MTLDEWKAIQNKDRAKVEFNIRKPNEGADGQWKKGFVLHKSKSEEVGYNIWMLWIALTVNFIGCRVSYASLPYLHSWHPISPHECYNWCKM